VFRTLLERAMPSTMSPERYAWGASAGTKIASPALSVRKFIVLEFNSLLVGASLK